MTATQKPISKSAAIRALNDQFRKTRNGGSIVMTSGVGHLGVQFQNRLLEALAAFDDFDPDNDPYAEHDFGSIAIESHKVFFKIDYFDLALTYHSPNAADPNVTRRVLTLMLAEEY